MTAPAPEIAPAARPRRRVPWWLRVVAGAGGLTAIVALLGGFEEVPIAQLPEIGLGESFIGNEVALQVDDIYLSGTAPVTEYDAPDGDVYLIVEATVENTTRSPHVFLGRALRVIVEGAVRSDEAPYQTVELRNGDGIQFLQPGLPTKVAYLWAVRDGSVAPGDRIVLGIFERYDFVDDPRFDDSKTDPVPVVRLVETVGDEL